MSTRRNRPRPCPIELLEQRYLLAAVAVDAGQVVRVVNDDLLGINVAWWDTSLNTAQTKQLVQDAGFTSFRYPGGSSSDEYHFADPPAYAGKGSAKSFASFITSVNGTAMTTLNYGTGSPQEAVAWLASGRRPLRQTSQVPRNKPRLARSIAS